MSVKNVPAVVNINLKHCRDDLLNTRSRAVGVVKSVEKKKSVAVHFAFKYKSETYYWTQQLNKEDYGVGKYWVLLTVAKE